MDSQAYSALAREVASALQGVKREWLIAQLGRQGRSAALGAKVAGTMRGVDGAPVRLRRRATPQWPSGQPVTAADRRAAAEVYNRAREGWLRRMHAEAADSRYPAMLSDPPGPYTRMLLGL